MPRPGLEAADIFRARGAACRHDHAGHLSLPQLKVMSAIESCRTAALGGHVAACTKCTHQHVAYNSCRNRHCPHCQRACARDWMQARLEGLLPVEYFHAVFTLPARIADIAYQNKAAAYGLLVKVSSQTLLTIAAGPKHPGVKTGMTSVLQTWGSAMTHHPHVHVFVPGGRLPPDGTRWSACRPGGFPAGEGPVEAVSALGPRRADQAAQSRRAQALRRSGGMSTPGYLRCPSRAAAQNQPGRLCQTALRRAGSRACLCEPVYPPGGYLKP